MRLSNHGLLRGRLVRLGLAIAILAALPAAATAAPVNLLDGLVGYWNFDEAGGAVAHNSGSGSSLLDGTLIGDAAFATGGMFGGAVSMTSTGYVDIVNKVIPDQATQYTYSVWFKNSSTSASGQTYMLESAPSGTTWAMSARLNPPSTESIQVFARTQGTGGGDELVNVGAVPANRLRGWNLLTVTYQQGVALRAYLNGSFVGADTVLGQQLVSTDGLHIGADRDGNRRWNGRIDDVGVWNRVLTDDEIAYLWNSGGGLAISQPVNILDGLVASWQFNETSGAVAHSTVPASPTLDGNLMGDAHFVSGGKFGGAVALDGVGDYVDVVNRVIPDGASAYTVTAWVKPTDLSGTVRQCIFETSGSWAISAELSTTNQRVMYSVQAGGGTARETDFLPTENEWFFLALAYDAVADFTKVYVNGAELAAYRGDPSGALAATNGFHIGTYRDANGRWFKGLIDEVSVWNRALNSTEIAYLWNDGAGLQVVPEPAAWVLLALGGLGVAGAWRRRRR